MKQQQRQQGQYTAGAGGTRV